MVELRLVRLEIASGLLLTSFSVKATVGFSLRAFQQRICV
jgi:hypothetical protein